MIIVQVDHYGAGWLGSGARPRGSLLERIGAKNGAREFLLIVVPRNCHVEGFTACAKKP